MTPTKREECNRIRAHLERFRISTKNDLQDDSLWIWPNGSPVNPTPSTDPYRREEEQSDISRKQVFPLRNGDRPETSIARSDTSRGMSPIPPNGIFPKILEPEKRKSPMCQEEQSRDPSPKRLRLTHLQHRSHEPVDQGVEKDPDIGKLSLLLQKATLVPAAGGDADESGMD